MYSEKSLQRVKTILKKIDFIENIISQKGSIITALEDEAVSRAAILMHLTSIAKQFDKLLHDGELELLSNFEKEDIKGSYDLRNFIAHDYEGVDPYIVEDVVRKRLPLIKRSVLKILNEQR